MRTTSNAGTMPLSEMIWAMEEIANERPNEPKLFRDTGVAATSGWKKDLGMSEMEFPFRDARGV